MKTPHLTIGIVALMLLIYAWKVQASPAFTQCDSEFPSSNGVAIYPIYYSVTATTVGADLAIQKTINQLAIGADTINFICKYGAGTNGDQSIAAIAFNRARRIPDWVSYKANFDRAIPYAENLEKLTRNGSNFYMDQDLIDLRVSQAIPYSYAESNSIENDGRKYAKGHFMPSHAALWHPVAQNASFSLANAAPQHPAMNSGVWNRIESWVSAGAKARKTLYVITGAYGTSTQNNTGTIESSSSVGSFTAYAATIPACFYKIIYQPLTQESIAFLVPNIDTARGEPWTSYVLTVNDLERRMLLAAKASITPPQTTYSIRFLVASGTRKDWPLNGPSNIHDSDWPSSGLWSTGAQSIWYTYPAIPAATRPVTRLQFATSASISAPALKPDLQNQSITFPGC